MGPNVYVSPYFTAARTQTFIRNLSAARKLSIVDSISSFKFAGSTLTFTVAQRNIFRDWRFDSAGPGVGGGGGGGRVNTFRAWAVVVTVKQSKTMDEEINMIKYSYISTVADGNLSPEDSSTTGSDSLVTKNERVSLFQYMTTTSSPVVVSRNIVKRLEISMFIGRNALALLLKQ